MYPAMEIASGTTQFSQFVEAGVGDTAAGPPDGAAQQRSRRNLHRRPIRSVGGQPVGDLAGPLPTHPGRANVSNDRPAAGAHMPVERGTQVPRGLQVLGDQSGILIDRARLLLFDRRGQAPVQFGAPRLQLRLVGHRADQRVPKHILGPRGRHHSIDQFRLQ